MFSCHKNQPNTIHLLTSLDRFLNRRGYLADVIFCHLLNVKFPFTHVSRNVAVFIQI